MKTFFEGRASWVWLYLWQKPETKNWNSIDENFFRRTSRLSVVIFMTKTGNQKLKLNCWKPLWRTSRERRDPGPSCQAQATRGEGREGIYNDSAFSIWYVTNIQSMQTGTLEALNLDPATILSPCPLHPLQITWLQWWGILQIHCEEKKSKKKPKHPILFDVFNSMVSLLAHKASINFLHFFL